MLRYQFSYINTVCSICDKYINKGDACYTSEDGEHFHPECIDTERIMTFKDKEKEIKEYIEDHGGGYVYEGNINAFYVSFLHLDDYIMFSSKNPWNDSKKIRVTCYQQKLTKEDFEFIINFIEYLENLGFKEGE